MPKVYLRQSDRDDAREARETATLTLLLKTARGRLDREEQDLAREAGIHPATFCRLKRPGALDKVDFRTVRRLAHAIGCTAEDWLKAGGFGR